MDYCKYHYEVNMNKDDSNYKDKNWDKYFDNIDKSIIPDILNDTNFLESEVLLDYLCKLVATWISGKSHHEILNLFNASESQPS